MKQRLSTQLALRFGMIVFVTIALISVSANVLIRHQFEKNISERQRTFSEELAGALVSQYNDATEAWNLDYIHGFGMYALKEGYILKVYDRNGKVVWDAENHDMTACHQVMKEISTRMQEKRPDLDGNFVTHRYELKRSTLLKRVSNQGNDQEHGQENNQENAQKTGQENAQEHAQKHVQEHVTIGYLDVSYYSPYYFSESDFAFLDSMNRILLIVGISSMVGAVGAGVILARRLSVPITKMTEITGKISEGNYAIRFESEVQTQELAELSSAVNQMAESLERQEILRRRLTSDVAHELRTPIANVSSYLEAIIEGVWEPTADRLQNCYEELGRISALIGDLERLRQIENENMRLEKEKVDLLELAQSVRSAFEPEFENKHLTCTVTGEKTMMLGDPKRLHQAIFNLVSNAIKYSNEYGEIQIAVHEQEESAIVEVSDQGIGISQDDLPLIFERFYRTDRSRNRKTGGAGIGLTITKAIVQAHGGKIVAESRENHGSKFVMTLPRGNIDTDMDIDADTENRI